MNYKNEIQDVNKDALAQMNDRHEEKLEMTEHNKERVSIIT